ncbi:hypothetical protein PV433_11880 [Paenibacillus sp. GYB004]|uniref:hypothetical protein n=1 Tax=Paenibacillus sp. GYB004 TaxID=2994393 RepID=UPI002F9640E2
MNILQSKADLLAIDSNVYPEPLRRFASELLQSIDYEVDPEEQEEFLLRNPIILCEPGDNITALLEASPFGYEYIERLDLEGVTVFRAGVLLDNEWFVQYLIPEEAIDAEIARWLDEHASAGGAVR